MNDFILYYNCFLAVIWICICIKEYFIEAHNIYDKGKWIINSVIVLVIILALGLFITAGVILYMRYWLIVKK